MNVYIRAGVVGGLGPVVVKVVVLPFELGLSHFNCFTEWSICLEKGLGERFRSGTNSLGRAI